MSNGAWEAVMVWGVVAFFGLIIHKLFRDDGPPPGFKIRHHTDQQPTKKRRKR